MKNLKESDNFFEKKLLDSWDDVNLVKDEATIKILKDMYPYIKDLSIKTIDDKIHVGIQDDQITNINICTTIINECTVIESLSTADLAFDQHYKMSIYTNEDDEEIHLYDILLDDENEYMVIKNDLDALMYDGKASYVIDNSFSDFETIGAMFVLSYAICSILEKRSAKVIYINDYRRTKK